MGVVRFLDTEHNAKRINAFGLTDKKLWPFEVSWILNEFEINNKQTGGDVEGVNTRGATTHTASRA